MSLNSIEPLAAPAVAETAVNSAEEVTPLQEIELAYLARKHRLAHPRGRSDNARRWYPDTHAEGGTPDVRSPSRAWPFSYSQACRTRKWCRQLPEKTRREDAQVARAAIASGQLPPPKARKSR